jgi:hypothetical protein
MCLDIIFVNDLQDQIGYKVFRKRNKKIHGCLYENPMSGEHYPIKRWITDSNEVVIWKPLDMKIRYQPGFHIYHRLESAIKQLGIYSKSYIDSYCIFKVKYRKIVVVGAQDPTLCQNKQDAETVIVAKEMKLLEEIKVATH